MSVNGWYYDEWFGFSPKTFLDGAFVTKGSQKMVIVEKKYDKISAF